MVMTTIPFFKITLFCNIIEIICQDIWLSIPKDGCHELRKTMANNAINFPIIFL